MNQQIKIEKGIPIPNGRGGKYSSVDWAAMQVGDSVLLPEGYGRAAGINSRGHRFVSRIETHKGVKRYRVWRIA